MGTARRVRETPVPCGGGGIGNQWVNISTGLDGSALQAIVTNPTRGSHEAYAATARGVFYNPNTVSVTSGPFAGAAQPWLTDLTDETDPVPVAQFVVRDRGRFIARVDFAYPELRIAIELDGFRYHDQSVFELDRAKRLDLTTAGWQVLEITWKMLVSDAASVFRRLDRLIRETRTPKFQT